MLTWGRSQVPMVHQNGTLLTLHVYTGYIKAYIGKITGPYGPSDWYTLKPTCLNWLHLSFWGRSQVHQTGILLTPHVYTDYIKAYMGKITGPYGPSDWYTLNSTC